MATATSSLPAGGHRHEVAPSQSNAETPSKRAAATTTTTGSAADEPMAVATMTAPREDETGSNGNDAAPPSGEEAIVRSPPKRPRISPSNDSDANESRGAPVATTRAVASSPAGRSEVIDITSSATPAPSVEVIDISSVEPFGSPMARRPRPAGDAAFRIKKDPGVKSPTKNSTKAIMMDDSDVEVLSPSRYTRPASGSSNDLSKGINDMHADEVEVTASTTTNANIEYPHMRHQCGVHPFSSITSNGTGGSSNDNKEGNGTFCAKCYCFVCDLPAKECGQWKERGRSAHCHAHDKDERWVQLREASLKSKPKSPTLPPRNPYHRQNNADSYQSNSRQAQQHGMHQRVTALIHNEFLSRLATDTDAATKSSAEEQRRQRVRERKEMRIPEVLLENFNKAVSLHETSTGERDNNIGARAATAKENTPPTQRQKMEGDIPTLSLHRSFFVKGIKIGWPFPEVMKPQRQMAFQLVTALMNRKHVVLESPTGTGKSAAILCSVLAWQRHHHRMERAKRDNVERDVDSGNSLTRDDGEEEGGRSMRVKIIYCSRTHSQVAQMVASLKSTPYRPRMAILGSRDRLCIHESIRPRGPGAEAVPGVNINNECRLRVRNTEKARKARLSNPGYRDPYDDDDPPEVMPGDGDGGGQEGMDDDDDQNQAYIARSRTCPHYRQLTASRVAALAHSTFVPNKQVDCCSVGGKKSKYGAHDIEDLVDFGVDPYLQKDVALYREADQSFGLSMKGGGRGGGCFVREVKPNTPADVNGSITAGDKILRVNGSDVSRSDPPAVVGKIKQTGSGLLMLDVSRGGSGSLSSGGDGGYSSRAACPYYISQVLSKDADIVFAPYNYVLDPGIREALGIELGNSVVILDEAHNVESTLREAGSGKFGEFELCELIVMLNNYAVTERSTGNLMDVGGGAGPPSESDTQYLCDVAHTLLLFVEKVIDKLRTARICFQNNPGKKGAAMALKEWEKFHTADDNAFEVTFDGPTGKGHLGKCVGCLPFFERLGLTKQDLDNLRTYVDAFERFFRGREGNEATTERDRISTLVDRLTELVCKLNAAIQTPEHYYTAVVATANGSLEFASGGDGEIEGGGRGRRSWKKKPRALPLVSPKTPANPDRPANPCMNPFCRAQCTDALNPIRHGNYCDGSTPKWECHLHLALLTPGPLMQELSNECRTVVLASGSLSPIPSLCAELNLFPAANAPLSPVRSLESNQTGVPKIQKRLQDKPKPLEADHVVDLQKQLFACSIGHFPDGSELRVSQKNYSQPDFLPKLGETLVRIIEGIPYGGVLVFLPSYALLRKCERSWNPNSFRQNRRAWWSQHEETDGGDSVWDRLIAAKHKVIVEPSGGQDEFEEKKQEYMDSVRMEGGCVLLAVFRGKMSEGISFNDNNARCVVCVGLPLPSAFALPIKVKMNYNDEQRAMRKRTDLLPGREWYNQQAYRAIAQALGRCIRHAADYGAIFLLDARHCNDGSPNDGIPKAHKNLPKWMRRSVRNLSRRSTGKSSMYNYMSSASDISGGWPGLKTELQRFFKNAKHHTNVVMKKQKEKIAVAGNSTVVHSFNVRTNQWSEKHTPPPNSPLGSPCTSNESNNLTSTTLKQTSLSISGKTKPSSLGNTSQPPKQTQGSAKKKGTLHEMFKKQHGAGGTQKLPTPKSSKPTKKATLKTMFEKQRVEASTSPLLPTQDMADVEQDEIAEEPASNPDPLSTMKTSSEPIAQNNSPPANSFTFRRSPFADDMLTPATEVAASTSHLALSQIQLTGASQPAATQSQALSTAEEEERLCVVCEDGKKEVLLIPCKHMCLCKKCADTCLYKTIKECPMCRATVKDSMEVFW